MEENGGLITRLEFMSRGDRMGSEKCSSEEGSFLLMN
jgi:hypothetical protein